MTVTVTEAGRPANGQTDPPTVTGARTVTVAVTVTATVTGRFAGLPACPPAGVGPGPGF